MKGVNAQAHRGVRGQAQGQAQEPGQRQGQGQGQRQEQGLRQAQEQGQRQEQGLRQAQKQGQRQAQGLGQSQGQAQRRRQEQVQGQRQEQGQRQRQGRPERQQRQGFAQASERGGQQRREQAPEFGRPRVRDVAVPVRKPVPAGVQKSRKPVPAGEPVRKAVPVRAPAPVRVQKLPQPRPRATQGRQGYPQRVARDGSASPRPLSSRGGARDVPQPAHQNPRTNPQRNPHQNPRRSPHQNPRRNPRRTGGLLLAIGTLLAIAGLSTVDHSAASAQVRSGGAARTAAATAGAGGAAASASALALLPVQVPYARNASPQGPVPLDRLAGPKPSAPMGFSVPVHISVPRAHIDADVASVGLTLRSAPGVLPLRRAGQAAWYDLGPAPGQLGVAVVDAHVAARTSGAVRPGDTLEVTRADHSLAVFTVDATERVPSWRAPAAQPQFSGPAPYAALSLVTCSGSLDTWRHGCLDHTIVHAHLTSGRRLAGSGRGAEGVPHRASDR